MGKFTYALLEARVYGFGSCFQTRIRKVSRRQRKSIPWVAIGMQLYSAFSERAIGIGR